MGREIRRVPKGWEHPRNEKGHYKPLYDETFEEAAREWVANFELWRQGQHADQLNEKSAARKYQYYWQWSGNPPNEESYRPAFDSEPICYQIYENVSEGTPDSPVFETQDEMIDWLIQQGHSEHSARAFVHDGYVPSMVIRDGKIAMGIDSLDLF